MCRPAWMVHRNPARITLLTLVLFLAWSSSAPATDISEPAWHRLTSGLAVTSWNPAAVCSDVPPLVMVQIDPDRFRFSIHQYLDAGVAAPLSIQEWQRRTGAYFLFNAGLFREDYSYLGLLLKDGRPLGSKRHHSWQGVFAAEPLEPMKRKAKVFDLAFDVVPDERFPYREAAQSLMLLDRTGKPRVRHTGKRAYQTVVAEDAGGAIVVMRSTGPVSLYALAECMRNSLPNVRQAMAMDGGSSSDIMASPELLGAAGHNGQDTDWQSTLDGSATHHIPLPAVIGVAPRIFPRPTGQSAVHTSAPTR